jgi:hypothetical protein
MGEAVIAKMREAVAKSAPSLTRRAYGRVLMLMASTCSWRAHAPAILSHRSCVPAGYRRRALWRVSVSSRDHLRSLSFFFSCDSCSWCGAHHGVCACKMVYVHGHGHAEAVDHIDIAPCRVASYRVHQRTHAGKATTRQRRAPCSPGPPAACS